MISTVGLTGQQHFEFEVTDTDGNTQNLYQDYLNDGKTVVIKLFFVACPPCNSIAKDFQAKYVEWGEGQHDVQFMEVTTSSGDNNADVIGYKNKHGITFPSISQDGGAGDVSGQYKSGFFGTYWGTPSFAIIAPDGSTDYGPGSLSSLDDAIAATGAQKPGEEVQNTIVNLNLSWTKDQPGDINDLEVMLQSADGGPQYDIMTISEGTLSFEYPSDLIPELIDPILTIEYNGSSDVTRGVSASDITVLRKHVLDLDPFQSDEKLMASDVNGDGKVSSIDIITLRKVILGFDLLFPNSVKSYTPDQNNIPVMQDPGAEIDINVKMIKMGDLN
ncbi:MAG: redoxin domain-containing protein [Saprospiraceae bacterium]|nr:redoxin domain-containing protein [Saprospiraceae bacterium]